MATRLGNWLRRANGFQRLWFVLSIVLILYLTFVNPFVIRGSDLPAYQYKWAVEREFKNPQCHPYLTERFEKLREP
jgi:hypothetical protein